MNLLSRSTLGCVAVALAQTCHAQAAQAPAIPKPMQALVKSGYTVGKGFDAGHGLTGWPVSRGGESHIVFTTKDGQVMLLGALYDAQGVDLTAAMTAKYASGPNLRPAYDAIEKSTWIADAPAGTARRVIYVIFDPNCPYCSIAWKALRPHVASGIAVRWVPVAYLRPSSAAKVAAIVGAPDPAAALKTNEEGFNEAAHEGGIAPLAEVPASVASALAANDKIMQQLGSNATPTWIWKDDAGVAHMVVGNPPAEKMLDILGIRR